MVYGVTLAAISVLITALPVMQAGDPSILVGLLEQSEGHASIGEQLDVEVFATC